MTAEAIVLDVFHPGRPFRGDDRERVAAALHDLGRQGIVLFAPWRRTDPLPEIAGFEVWRAPTDRSLGAFGRLIGQARTRGLDVALSLGPPTALQRAFAVACGAHELHVVHEDGGRTVGSLWSSHGVGAAGRWLMVELPFSLAVAGLQRAARAGGDVVALSVVARHVLRDPGPWGRAYREAVRSRRGADG